MEFLRLDLMKLINDKNSSYSSVGALMWELKCVFSTLSTHEMPSQTHVCQSHEGLIENVLNFKSWAFFCCLHLPKAHSDEIVQFFLPLWLAQNSIWGWNFHRELQIYLTYLETEFSGFLANVFETWSKFKCLKFIKTRKLQVKFDQNLYY